jgi:ferrous iron transport protein A
MFKLQTQEGQKLMTDKRQLTLNQLKAGQTGTVVQIIGGRGLVMRLTSMGIRPGKKITKVSALLFRGPVTLRLDGIQIAVGFGMANRIMVEADSETPA